MQTNLTCEQLDELIATGRPVIIDMFAEWCGPCKMLAPIFERVAEANAERAEFVKIDIDVRPELAERYNVMTVPTVVGIAGGEVMHSSAGLMNEPSLLALIDRLNG